METFVRCRWIGLPLLLVSLGCQIAPERIQQIEVENTLLREQIQTIKKNCEYYKSLEVEVEESESPKP